MTEWPKYSFAELSFYISRAAVGACFPTGDSEEIAAIAVYLAQRGIDPTADCSIALTCGLPQPMKFHEEKQCAPEFVVESGPNPMTAITAIRDRVELGILDDVKHEYTVHHPCAVLTLLACLSRAAELFWHTEIEVELEPAQVRYSLPRDLNQVFRYHVPIRETDRLTIITVGDAGKSLEKPRSAASGGIAVADLPWSDIQKLFKKSLVPSSDSSREGAGAGLTDND